MNNNLIDFNNVFLGLRSGDGNLIKQNEILVKSFALNNYVNYVALSADYLHNEVNDQHNRQLCGVILKNVISAGAGYHEFNSLWMKVDDNIRNSIKNTILSCLGSISDLVRSSVSSCISAICSIEFPLGKWQELIKILDDTSTNEDFNFRLASVMTIKNIMQDVPPSCIQDTWLALILFSIMKNIDKDVPYKIRREAVEALSYSIISLKAFFDEVEKKKALFNIIFSTFDYPEDDMKVFGMTCMLEACKYFYYQLEDLIPSFLIITKNLILPMQKVPDDENKSRTIILCLDLWANIAEQERFFEEKRFPHRFYIVKNQPGLFEICSHILKIRRQDEDDDTWHPYKSVSILLSTMSKVCSEELIDNILATIDIWLKQGNNKLKHSALVLFYTIIESKHIAKVNKIILEGFNSIISHIKDNDLEIRLITSLILIKISKAHSKYLSPEFFQSYIELLYQELANPDKRVVYNIVKCLHEISLQMPLGQNTSKYLILLLLKTLLNIDLMSKYAGEFLNKLFDLMLDLTNYDVNNNVCYTAALSIGTIIEHSANDINDFLVGYLVKLVGALDVTLYPEKFNNNKDIQENYQAFLCTCISSIIVGRGRVPINNDQFNYLYDIVIKSFKARGDIYKEGMLIISNLAQCKFFSLI